MASSSSAKKVARVAARSSGGPSSKNQKNWLFPVAIVVIVLLGVGVVAAARSQNAGSNDNDTPPRAQLAQGQPADHWHAAFAINVCGKELPALTDASPEDPLGIHTHGDGLIHIHPFSVRSGGKNATMARFFDQTGLKVTDDAFELPSTGKVYKAGETTCGGKPTELVMAHWKDGPTAAQTKPDKIFRGDFAKVRYTEDLGAYTLALVEKGSRDVPAPSSAPDIKELGAADAGGSTSGSGSASTLPPELTATTAPTATTAAPATTAASGSEGTTATTAAGSGG